MNKRLAKLLDMFLHPDDAIACEPMIKYLLTLKKLDDEDILLCCESSLKDQARALRREKHPLAKAVHLQ